MFGWIFPRPPVDPREKAWTETRLQWLAEQFGPSVALEAHVLVPTNELWRDIDASERGASLLLDRFCSAMRADAKQLRLKVLSESPTAELPAEPGVVHLVPSQLQDPLGLSSTLVHQVARERLRLEANWAGGASDSAWMADLLSVFVGLGIFVAHAGLCGSCGPSGGCSPSLPGMHLPARMLGYASALFAWVRGEVRADWPQHLRPDAQVSFNTGLRYVSKSSDSLFTRESMHRRREALAADELIEHLRRGSPSTRVAALWALQDGGYASEAADQVSKTLRDRQAVIRAEAARTISCYGAAASPAIPLLVGMLDEPNFTVRCAAATALGDLKLEPAFVVPALAELLSDSDREVVDRAGRAIAQFDSASAAAATRPVMVALKTAMIRCDHDLVDTLTNTLFTLDPDATDRVMEFFQDDPELREQAIHMMVNTLETPDDGGIA